MALFRYLDDNAFLIFSRQHRFAYEAALLEVYARFFSAGAVFPTPQEVTHALYDLLNHKPELLNDDDPGEGFPEILSKGRKRLRFADKGGLVGDKGLRFAGQLYQGLVRTGWLEEEEYGLRVTVDMPMGALLVVQKFASLKSDVAQRFGGLVVHIKSSLDLVDRLSGENTEKTRSSAVHGLREARKQAEEFVRTLRAILSDLRRIRKSLTASQNLREKMDTYFEEFIGELLLKDFQSILTFNHPYRFRDQIIANARAIAADPVRMNAVVIGYIENSFSADTATANDSAIDDLLTIEDTFETVGEMFERIAQFRRALESRLRNTVKYSEQGERGLGNRARNLIRRMEHLLAEARQPGRYESSTVPAAIEPFRSIWSRGLLAAPRHARAPIEAKPLAVRPVDPFYLFKKKLRADYLARIMPTPEQIRLFLERKIPPYHAQEARFIEIGDVDQFLAFDAVRRYALTKEVPAIIAVDFDIQSLPVSEPHDSEWLTCQNFIVRHRRSSAQEV